MYSKKFYSVERIPKRKNSSCIFYFIIEKASTAESERYKSRVNLFQFLTILGFLAFTLWDSMMEALKKLFSP